LICFWFQSRQSVIFRELFTPNKAVIKFLVTFLCRVTSNTDAGAVGNNSVDYPGQTQSTFPAPPVKRPYRRLLDASSAEQVKTKRHSSVSAAVDQNLNDIATHGRTLSLDSASRSTPVSSGQEITDRQRGCEESVRQTVLNDECDLSTALSTSMRVLWSGQVTVNGTEVCSAELMSRCHIRRTL